MKVINLAIFFIASILLPLSLVRANDIEHGPYDLSDIEDDNLDDPHAYHDDSANYDDFEKFNRGIYSINKALDTIILKPVATIYKVAIPDWSKDRVDSFINNLYEPISFINATFQGDQDLAAKSISRFLVNTVVGLGGLFDVASQNGEELAPEYTDFGLTLKHYDVQTGPYLVLPFFGPSSLRDASGLGVDWLLDPFSHIPKRKIRHIRFGVEAVHTRYKYLDVTDELEKSSLDEYVTIRSIYFQKRK